MTHLDLTVGQDPGRLRPEPGGLGAGPRSRARPAPDHAAARRGAGARRARRPAAADRQGHRRVHPQRRRRTSSSPPSPSTASATPRSTAGRAASRRSRRIRRTDRRRRAPPSCAGPGTFECSDELLNQLHRNVVWGTRGNFLDVPTDCPQRDERLGWTGDIAAFAPVGRVPVRRRRLPARLAARSGRRAGGGRRHGAVRRARRPEVHRSTRPLPTAGQHGRLERRRGLGAVGALAGLRRPPGARATSSTRWPPTSAGSSQLLSPTGLWDTGFQFGDWLDPTAPPDKPADAKADNGRGGHRLPLPQRHLARRGRRDPGPGRRRRVLRPSWPTGPARRSTSTTSSRTAPSTATRTTVYALAIVFGLLDEQTDTARRRAAGRSWSPTAATTSRPASPARLRHRRPDQHRPPRRRLPAAAAAASARPGSTR